MDNPGDGSSKITQLPMFSHADYDFGFGFYTQQWVPPSKPLGSLTLSFFGRDVTFMGGPYRAKPDGMIGVKMAEESPLACDIDVPTRDFSIPDPLIFERGLLAAAAAALLRTEGVYVGCLGGRGRTGLFLATLAHMSGLSDPVGYVREQYFEHAVETVEQQHFVYSLSRRKFRIRLMTVLLMLDAVNCTWLSEMNWRDRLLYQWVKSTLLFRL